MKSDKLYWDNLYKSMPRSIKESSFWKGVPFDGDTLLSMEFCEITKNSVYTFLSGRVFVVHIGLPLMPPREITRAPMPTADGQGEALLQ